MLLKEATQNFSSNENLQENMHKITEFAENLKEFKKSNFMNLLRKYDNMNSLTLKSEYSEDVTEILPNEITRAVNQSTYNPIISTGYIKNSSTENTNENILDFNIENCSYNKPKINEINIRNNNANSYSSIIQNKDNYDRKTDCQVENSSFNKIFSDCLDSEYISSCKFKDYIESENKQCSNYVNKALESVIGKNTQSGLNNFDISNEKNKELSSQNLIKKLRGNSNIMEMNRRKSLLQMNSIKNFKSNSDMKRVFSINNSNNKLKKSIASDSNSNTNTINSNYNNCLRNNYKINPNNTNSIHNRQNSITKTGKEVSPKIIQDKDNYMNPLYHENNINLNILNSNIKNYHIRDQENNEENTNFLNPDDNDIDLINNEIKKSINPNINQNLETDNLLKKQLTTGYNIEIPEDYNIGNRLKNKKSNIFDRLYI